MLETPAPVEMMITNSDSREPCCGNPKAVLEQVGSSFEESIMGLKRSFTGLASFRITSHEAVTPFDLGPAVFDASCDSAELTRLTR